jgi:hypothetical protein
MPRKDPNGLNRREFLKQAGAAALAAGLLEGCNSSTNPSTNVPLKGKWKTVALVCDPNDPVANSAPAKWALDQLRQSLESRGFAVQSCQKIEQAPNSDLCIVASKGENWSIASRGGTKNPSFDEFLSISIDDQNKQTIIAAAGGGPRGLVYALTDLADRVTHASDPSDALQSLTSKAELPANRIRCITRSFVSDVEDKGWFNDRDSWQRYLSMLVTQRFNRLHLALGVGYDFARGLTDTYFYFAYPFLVNVPGYSVRANPLPDEERDRNLQMLRFISDQAALRGLQFQLGIWTHAYQWTNSPQANYVIEGLTPETQAAYSRDALHMVLDACPNITGVTLRVHGESGVAEGNYDFWKTLFSGIVATGRKLEIDMHAKGMDQKMLDTALQTGLPVNVSPKFWAEHMGLPYMQSSIRQEEMPRSRNATGLLALSSGTRSFLRYGYGDLLTKDRKYGVIHRIWPGTQRLLLWGDPTYAAEYGRLFSFCGSDGVDIFEPLSFKGRKGSGLPGGRDAYADKSLKPAGGDWEKYLYTYRLLGRLAYNPDCDPQVLSRGLEHEFGAAAPALQSALAKSSRILPLITTAHDPSAANNNYWPEIYLNMPIVTPAKSGPYTDTPQPRVFTTVGSLDPQIFSTCAEYVDGLLAGKASGKYSPLEVAVQLESWAQGALDDLAGIEKFKLTGSGVPGCNRLSIDSMIAASTGLFFANKFRAGVFHVLFDRTGFATARDEALKGYRAARESWAQAATRADGVYVRDITFGSEPQLRGSWSDRLTAIDADIAAMESQQASKQDAMDMKVFEMVSAAAAGHWNRPDHQLHNRTALWFHPGAEIALELGLKPDAIRSARLWYRHVNQAENWRSLDMEKQSDSYKGTIPGDYTNSPYPMQYYFELTTPDNQATLFPGFGKDFTGQPYFVVQAM